MERLSTSERNEGNNRSSIFERSRIALALICAGIASGGCDKPDDEELGPEWDIPTATATASATPVVSAKPPEPKVLTCPPEMVKVKDALCVDRYESSLVDKVGQRPVSRFYPPTRSQTVFSFTKWKNDADMTSTDISVPIPPAWQRSETFEVEALSKPNVYPNAYVNYVNAERACENSGKRLCTKDEWVTACRGEDDTLFPYGEEYKVHACNVFRWTHPGKEIHDSYSTNHDDPRLLLVKDKRGRDLLRKTGATKACASKWGDDAIFDMVGNIDEWIDHKSPAFKGGFFSRTTKKGCDSTYGKGHSRKYQDYSLGMRCCKDAK